MPAPSLDPVFRPRSVAVVGASRDPHGIGRVVFDNLLAGGFAGPVYPIHPTAREVGSVRAYASVLDVPDAVDLAVVAVPASRVLDVVDECGRKGVKGLVIITAGFREIGGEGSAREERLASLLRRYGMRAIGPNCMGIMNPHPDVRLNATFSPARIRHGGIAFVSQSGALGMAILDQAAELNLGLSRFVSLGNKTNVSTNDLLLAWEHDDDVRLILLYLENFGNPRKFVELARRITPTKPIVAVKSGRTTAGARAARSHTGALAERDVFAEALFEQCGVIRARTIRELFDYARVFSRSPAPKGDRVAIVTNSGGPGIMATDALAEYGLALAELAPETTRRLREGLLPEASVQNPVDVIAGGGPDHVRLAVTAALADPGVDAVVAIYTPPAFVDETAVARAIAEPGRQGKPLVACVLGREAGGEAFHRLTDAGVPTFTFPEGAVRALAAHRRYEATRARPRGEVPPPPSTGGDADDVLAAARARGAEWLDAAEASDVMSAYGVPMAPFRLARSPQEAEAAGEELGGRLALKAAIPGVTHKTEADGVLLDVPAADAGKAFLRLEDAVRARGRSMTECVVQRMAPAGREVVIGMAADPKFGPLLMFGLGGVYVEVLRDVVFRLAPLTDDDARRMVRAVRAWPLLEGARGKPPADVPAVERALLAVSALVTEHPEIAEIDLNPLIVANAGGGALAVDARVRLWPGGHPPRAPAVTAEMTGGEP